MTSMTSAEPIQLSPTPTLFHESGTTPPSRFEYHHASEHTDVESQRPPSPPARSSKDLPAAGHRRDQSPVIAPLNRRATTFKDLVLPPPGAPLSQLPALYWATLKNRWWLWELFALCLSTLAMIAVLVLLRKVDGMTLAAWSFPIRPNSMASVFMTIAKYALLVPVTASISQSKWTQFHKSPRNLMALQHFDDASRGPVGAVRLLLNPGVAGLAWFGALLVVLSLALDPFVQQIIAFRERTVVAADQQASIYTTQTVETIAPRDFMASIIGSIYLEQEAKTNATCSTSSCKWDRPVTSLGVCHMCRNMTDVAPTCYTSPGPLFPDDGESWSFTTTNCTYAINQNISLPIHIQNLRLPAAGGRPEEWASQYSQIVASAVGWQLGLGDIIADGDENIAWITTSLVFTTFFNKDKPPLPQVTLDVLQPTLSACGIYWCAQVYDALEVQNGIAKPSIPSSTYPVHRVKTPQGKWTYVGITRSGDQGQQFFLSDEEMAKFPGNSTFAVTDQFEDTAEGVLSDSLTLIQTSGNDVFDVFPAPNRGLNVFIKASNQDLVWGAFRRVARTITNRIRMMDSIRQVTGHAYIEETYVQVGWAWMALPLTVLALANALLAVTIFVNRRRRMRVWKSSAIALLLHPLRGCEENELSRLADLAEMEQFANGMQVKLEDSGGKGFKFIKVH